MQDRAQSARARKDVSLHSLEEMDWCSTRPSKDELEKLAVQIQNRLYTKIALERLLSTSVLTEIQKQCFQLHVFRGLSAQADQQTGRGKPSGGCEISKPFHQKT